MTEPRRPLVARQTDGRPYTQPREQGGRIFHLDTRVNGRSGNVIDAYSREDAIEHAAKLIAVAVGQIVPGSAAQEAAENLVDEALRRQPVRVARPTGRATVSCQVRVGTPAMAVESL